VCHCACMYAVNALLKCGGECWKGTAHRAEAVNLSWTYDHLWIQTLKQWHRWPLRSLCFVPTNVIVIGNHANDDIRQPLPIIKGHWSTVVQYTKYFILKGDDIKWISQLYALKLQQSRQCILSIQSMIIMNIVILLSPHKCNIAEFITSINVIHY
jgi:hypothetical protein